MLLLWLKAGVLLGVLCAVDRLTGPDLSVTPFYSLIVFYVTWNGDRASACSFAVLCTLSWWWCGLDDHPYAPGWGYIWATSGRFFIFMFVAVAGSALKMRRESDRRHIEALERARQLEHEIAYVSEREQRRIGQDLHDGICQMLAATHFALSSTGADLAAKNLPEAEAVDRIAGMIKETMIETRNLARGIFPAQLEEVGLPAVIEELVGSVRRLQKVEAAVRVDGQVRVADPEQALHLYRITQEAFHNAIRHGGASKLMVSLAQDENGLRLVVIDDGTGLPKPLHPDQGMGLKTMRYRAHMIGGELSIENNPGGGATVACTLPQSALKPAPPAKT